MKKKNLANILVVLFVILLLGIIGFLLSGRYHVFKGHTLGASTQKRGAEKAVYYCPMHPSYTSDKPGDCPICNMKLVKKDAEHAMGMEAEKAEGGVFISPERQQFIGVKQEKAQKRSLTRQILTVGRIAYDPELYLAQEEYLQSLKTLEALSSSSIAGQSKSLVEAAERKLLLLGMSKEQIEGLAAQGKPQGNLYLPTKENTVWVYMTIYEYEMGLVKEGILVEIESIAFPGEVFTGNISSITPVIDPMTRSVQARVEVDNPENKLKPDMYVNVRINADLGEKLAVSKEAVINTGKRTLVVVMNENGNFSSRDVKLGQEAEGYYEVLKGLNEGDTVITSGNFLIDSESRLQSAMSGSAEHKHGQ